MIERERTMIPRTTPCDFRIRYPTNSKAVVVSGWVWLTGGLNLSQQGCRSEKCSRGKGRRIAHAGKDPDRRVISYVASILRGFTGGISETGVSARLVASRIMMRTTNDPGLTHGFASAPIPRTTNRTRGRRSRGRFSLYAGPVPSPLCELGQDTFGGQTP